MKKPILCLLLLLGMCWTFAHAAPPGETRIVSLVPSQTELLFEMGFGKSLIGVSNFCNFPPEIASLPRMGGVELDLERIVSLKPTIVMDIDGMHRRYELFFRQIGLKFKDYPIKHLADIPAAAKQMAADLGEPERGVAFEKKWNEELNAITKHFDHSPRVYLEIWDTPLQAAGPASFMGEMIQIAGGKNIFSDSDGSYPVVDPEEVLKANPEVILLAYPLGSIQTVAKRPGWSEITAIRKGNVRPLTNDSFVRPGPRCLNAIRELSEIFKNAK